jgi:parallel beta-helix repeat protein
MAEQAPSKPNGNNHNQQPQVQPPSSPNQPQQPSQQVPPGQPQNQTAQQQKAAPKQQQQPVAPKKIPRPKFATSNSKPLIIAILIIIIIGVVAFLFIGTSFLKGPTKTSTALSSVSSTVVQGNIGALTGCTQISSPGLYYLSQKVKATIVKGACITVNASNVKITCNNNKLIGSGPFVGVPPFSYGILVNGGNNITISGCTVKNFSYGVFAVSTNNLNINNNNLSINYMSNIFASNVHNGTVNNNYLSRASSSQGALYLTNGSSNLGIFNNTIVYNQYYGVNVNSSRNIFRYNLVNGSQYSFTCTPPNGYVVSSTASYNICYNNTGCGFVQCRGINIPDNVSKIQLGSIVSTCGTISAPGSYSLSGNINGANLVNVSNPLSLLVPCIKVASNNVQLNCKGFQISNTSAAIIVQNFNNFSIENCKISSASIAAITLYDSNLTHVSNVTLLNNNYGLYLYNSNINSVFDVTGIGNSYGIYLTSSYSNSFQNLNFSKNIYGVFLEGGSLANSFTGGAINNSTKIDVYATPDSVNSSDNLMESVSCGLTNALWAHCRQFSFVNLPFIPISACSNIKTPGNYILSTSLFDATPNCISITAPNTRLNCLNHTISSEDGVGSGLSVLNSVNVSLLDCGFAGFTTSVNVSNSILVKVNGIYVKGGGYGISLFKSPYSTITNSLINGTSNQSISLTNTTGSLVLNNTIRQGVLHNIGIYINNSRNNLILNNTGLKQYIGLEISGNAGNNTVVNNTMSGSYFDFFCNGNSGITAENGGLNYGITKSGCHWLAALSKINPAITCVSSAQSNIFTFSQDLRYATGSTCFDFFGNSSTIDCMGHTIIATNGGTFATFMNSQDSNLRNCFLKGFTTAVSAENSTITVLNNTILVNSSIPITIVNISGTRLGSNIKSNNITTPYTAISFSNTNSGALQNNYVSNASVAYTLYNDTGLTIQNNTAASTTKNGLIISNSTFALVQYNHLLSKGAGLQCIARSQGASNNTDLGGNICSSQINCAWIKSSSQLCP